MAEALSASGMNKLLLHAWERRYGIEPAMRSLSGRRFYTPDKVERLRLLKSRSDSAYRIGPLVNLHLELLSQIKKGLKARTASAMAMVVKALKQGRALAGSDFLLLALRNLRARQTISASRGKKEAKSVIRTSGDSNLPDNLAGVESISS